MIRRFREWQNRQPYKVRLWKDFSNDWQVKVTQGFKRIEKHDTLTGGRKGYDKARKKADLIIEQHKSGVIEHGELSAMPKKWTVDAAPTRAQLQARIDRLESDLDIA